MDAIPHILLYQERCQNSNCGGHLQKQRWTKPSPHTTEWRYTCPICGYSQHRIEDD